MNLRDITLRVNELCAETSGYIRKELDVLRAADIETKAEHNFVTYVDRTSEERLVDGLMKILPKAGFLAEEGKYGKDGADLRWIIDPLDGTTNFIHGVPFFCISIALADPAGILAGTVYEINRNECFYSWQGARAMLNGREIRVSGAASLKDSLLVTGFPYMRDHILDEYVDLFKGFIRRTQDLRRLGSASADLAFVAAGRFEGFYEYGLSPWDVAAGAFLVQQAGGMVTDFNGGADYIFGGSLVSSNSRIHAEMLEVVEQYFSYKNKMP
jgi:myo-inositol-1(or 4)-monophosphatase